MSYHKRKIIKGVFGEFSKIQEEFQETEDAHEQSNKIMELLELSDLVGAIEGYLDKHFSLKLTDILIMKDATRRAFESGHRNSKNIDCDFEIDATRSICHEYSFKDTYANLSESISKNADNLFQKPI